MERNIEAFATELENRFVNKHGTEGIIDFPSWLAFFTFDVISDMTWSKPYGFVPNGEDILGMIGWVSNFVKYGFIVSFIMCPHALTLTKLSNLPLQVGQMPSLDLLLRHNPFFMWLERKGWYNGSPFPGVPFAIQRISEREQRLKLAEDNANGRVDILEKVRRAKLERPDHITDKEVLGLTLSTIIAGAETT